MRLLLMRHGIAAPLGGDVTSDAERPLTEEGWRKTRAASRGLLICEPQIDLIATSPLLRSRQTAELVHHECSKGGPKLEVWPELEKAEYSGVLQRLHQLDENGTILCVGHEPGLSRLAAQLLSGSPTAFSLDFKKAAVCALQMDLVYEPPRTTLLYHLAPKQLRLLRKD